jgi:hypothetical protein
MNNIQKTLLLGGLIFSLNISGQDYIALNDGNGFFAKVISVDDSIIHFETTRTKSLPLKDVKLIEYEEKGVTVYSPNCIKKAAVRDKDYFGKDCRVYVPFSSTKVKQREGGMALRNLLKMQGYWHIVDCEEESNLIVELIIDETGEDMAYVRITDSSDSTYYMSPKTKAWMNLTEIINGNLSAQAFHDITAKGIGENLASYLVSCVETFQNEHDPSIPTLDVKNYTGDLFARGNSVFVPVGGEREDVIGALDLIQRLRQDGYWKIARSPKEAHFIMEFKFNDEGPDHANIFIRKQDGELMKESRKVKADEGEEIVNAVRKLYDGFVTRLQKN